MKPFANDLRRDPGSDGRVVALVPLARRDGPAAPIRLQVLGPALLVLGHDGGRQIAVPRILQAILGFLATQPNFLASREHLAWQLWGEVSDAQARQNLRQAIQRIKRYLAEYDLDILVADGQTIALDARVVRTDLQEFLANAESLDLPALEKAIAIYRGALLEGLETGRIAFDEWLRGERVRLERLAQQAMLDAAEKHLAAGSGNAAIAIYERLHAADPLNEEVHRLLLAAIAAHAGRQAALRRGERLADLMKAELNCRLEPRTLKLLDEILDTGTAAPAEPAASGRLPANMPSLVVLPFEMIGAAGSEDYLADGLAEDITAALSRLKWLFVVSRNAALRYRGQPVDPARIARDLGVRYVLGGSLRVAGSRLRIMVTLTDCTTARQIWSERYDRELADIFAVQDEITHRVLGVIEPQLYEVEGRRLSSLPPDQLDAWGLTVSAIGLIHRFEREPNARARDLLSRAVELAPDYARAHAVLSWARLWAYNCHWVKDRPQELDAALVHAETALRLDHAEPWSHMVVGFTRSSLREHARAIESLAMAVDLNPSFALGRMLLGWAQIRVGDFDAAIEETGRALVLRPPDHFGTVYQATHGLSLLAAGRFAEALPFMRASVSPFTEYMGHYNALVSCCGHLGLMDEARRWLAAREKMLGRRFTLAGATAAMAGFAHGPIFLEGLRKAGLS